MKSAEAFPYREAMGEYAGGGRAGGEAVRNGRSGNYGLNFFGIAAASAGVSRV